MLFGLTYAPHAAGMAFRTPHLPIIYEAARERMNAVRDAYAVAPPGDDMRSGPYRVDYLIWGPNERRLVPTFEPAAVDWLAEVFTQGDWRLYRVRVWDG